MNTRYLLIWEVYKWDVRESTPGVWDVYDPSDMEPNEDLVETVVSEVAVEALTDANMNLFVRTMFDDHIGAYLDVVDNKEVDPGAYEVVLTVLKDGTLVHEHWKVMVTGYEIRADFDPVRQLNVGFTKSTN